MAKKKFIGPWYRDWQIFTAAEQIFGTSDRCPLSFYSVHPYKGMLQAVFAAMLLVADPDLIGRYTKVLYPAVACRFRTTDKAVERNIRSFITCLWNYRRRSFDLFVGCTMLDQPTVTEFLSVLVQKLMHYNEEHPEERVFPDMSENQETCMVERDEFECVLQDAIEEAKKQRKNEVRKAIDRMGQLVIPGFFDPKHVAQEDLVELPENDDGQISLWE